MKVKLLFHPELQIHFLTHTRESSHYYTPVCTSWWGH